jgi:hypothetical protein
MLMILKQYPYRVCSLSLQLPSSWKALKITDLKCFNINKFNLWLVSGNLFIYSNSSVYEQSVCEFSLTRDAQINTCFPIYKPIFTEFLPLANRSLIPSGSIGKFTFVLWVFALWSVLEEQIKLVNRGITVYQNNESNITPKLRTYYIYLMIMFFWAEDGDSTSLKNNTVIFKARKT